jgi:GR25 family glycosyltransferase involved in LPS biosynthesis
MTELNINKVIYINLDERVDKKIFMETQLSNLGISFERFSAIKPTKDSLKGGKYSCFFKRATDRLRKYVNGSNEKRGISVFGCYLSHYFIHKQAKKDNWGNYLILEDDCVLNKGWDLQIQRIVCKNKEWDIIRSVWPWVNWSYRHTETKFESVNFQSRYSSKNINKFEGGTHFQLCNGKSASKILDYLDEEYLYNIDSVYSTCKINVLHQRMNVKSKKLESDIIKND